MLLPCTFYLVVLSVASEDVFIHTLWADDGGTQPNWLLLANELIACTVLHTCACNVDQESATNDADSSSVN